MTSNVLCKYFMNGACAFGDNCRFSHNRSDESSQVCKYYLAGNCAYGDRCRYEHSKPAWSARGQPAPPSRYTAPTGVPKPHVGPPPPSAAPAAAANGTSSLASLPSGASDLGLASSGQPNWDDFMTPDEMEEFEQWQVDQAAAAASSTRPPQAGSVRHPSGDFADIMDPADIPLCNEYAATGYCSAGDECLYIHGDPCEICGYLCVHPYNPEQTAQHQAACSEALAAAGYPVPHRPAAGNHHNNHAQQQHRQQHQPRRGQPAPPPPPPAAAAPPAPPAAAGAAAAAAGAAAEPAAGKLGAAAAPAAAESPSSVDDAAQEDQDAAVVSKTVAAAVAAVVAKHQQASAAADDENAAAVAAAADALAATHISSSVPSV